MEVANLFVKISADTENAINKLNKFDDHFKQIGANLMKVGVGMTATLTTSLTAVGTKAFDMAAQFSDAVGATDQIFKDSSDVMKDWASNLETYYGVAETEALTYANTMGAMLQNIGGLSQDEAAKQSQSLVQLAGDLSAMFGGTTESAVQALTGALKGNNTMLDNYGMAVTEATIKSKALEMGLIKEGQEMDLASKQAATLALIMEQAGAATGQAERESDGSSGTVKTLQTEMANLTKTLGEELLPIITPIIRDIVDLVKKFSSLDDGTKKLIVKIGLFLAVAGPIITVIGGIISVVGTVIGWFGGLALALSSVIGWIIVAVGQVAIFIGWIGAIMTPVGWVIAGIGALIAIIALINFDSVKEGVINAWKWVVEKFTAIVDFISNIDLFQAGKDLLTGLWNGIKDIWNGLWNWVSDIGKKISDAILGKQNEINDFNNKASAYTGVTNNKTVIVPVVSGSKKTTNNIGKVNWNADGGIFSRPTIFNTNSGLQGVGEKEPEAIMPLSKLDSMLSENNIDYDLLADKLSQSLGNVAIILDKKEVGNFVDKRIMKGAY